MYMDIIQKNAVHLDSFTTKSIMMRGVCEDAVEDMYIRQIRTYGVGYVKRKNKKRH